MNPSLTDLDVGEFRFRPDGGVPCAVMRDGAVWYTTRSGAKGAARVLYLDVGNIKTLAALY